jgi:hypothetical protein
LQWVKQRERGGGSVSVGQPVTTSLGQAGTAMSVWGDVVKERIRTFSNNLIGAPHWPCTPYLSPTHSQQVRCCGGGCHCNIVLSVQRGHTKRTNKTKCKKIWADAAAIWDAHSTHCS